MTTSQTGRVVLWMTGALLSFSAMAVSIRGLAGTLRIFEILTVRSVLALVILLSLAALWPELRAGLRPRQMRLNLLRNSIHFASQFAWALSITLLPFATVFALEFSMPVWVAILAVIFLGERVTSGRIGVIVLGLIGVLVILRPGLEAFRPASLLVLGAAFGFATFNILTKKLTATESTFGIVFWMNAMQLPMGLAGSDLLSFLKLGLAQLPWLLGLGIAGLSAHYCLANAFRSGDATLVVPLDFLRLPLIAIIGWLFFGETLDLFVFAGALLMVVGILWNLRSETRRFARLQLEETP
ncbi:MAG: DMT family transporter [Pseudomonadota bacterium]|nr:DMT family transporter [Pseudomonadota bacterium]